MSFAEFMRGKYDPTNEPYVSTLIVNMTQDEQRQISTDPFETIWQRLWKGDTTSSDFLMSREKFGLLDIARRLGDLVNGNDLRVYDAAVEGVVKVFLVARPPPLAVSGERRDEEPGA
jgi:hypothetical protein